jgi:hypothetical protein
LDAYRAGIAPVGPAVDQIRADRIEEIIKQAGGGVDPAKLEAALLAAQLAAIRERVGDLITVEPMAAPSATGETISQAAEAWFAEMQRDPTASAQANHAGRP